MANLGKLDLLENYKKPIKQLNECNETKKSLINENEKRNPYISLAKAFEKYEQGIEEDNENYYFYQYLQPYKKMNGYIFVNKEREITITLNDIEPKIDIFNPFVEIEYIDNNKREKRRVVHPQWHLIISFYAFNDAIKNHKENEFVKKMLKESGCPKGNYNIKCNSLNNWIKEAFLENRQ